MSTKQQNILSPGSCWNRAAPNEPVFVLRANDPLAPQIVRMWAARYAEMKASVAPITAEQRAKHREALDVAAAMIRYRIESDDDIPF